MKWRRDVSIHASIVAARTAGANETLGTASGAFIGVLGLGRLEIGGFLMHVEGFSY